MPDMRSCIKTGCRWPAAATLSYRYGTSEVWLSDLGEDHPATHDLCPHHADNLKVPRGWSLVDERQPAPVVHEPSAAEIVERVATLRETVDRRLEEQLPKPERTSRYADLLDGLPTYNPDGTDQRAGSEAVTQPTPLVTADEDEAGEPESVGAAPSVRMVSAAEISHGMAPVPRNLPALATTMQQTSSHQAGTQHRGAADDADGPAVVLTLPLRTDGPVDETPTDQ
ncbi:DUF3499 family protein [Euzebya tangerina]|uniref:DUF3499 family protein n=1 Tax=Euzebya tangerina TaxID=591198 RepID=UPI0013C2D4EC|nr:DUF3499 family protein [Euzebya tangerina]